MKTLTLQYQPAQEEDIHSLYQFNKELIDTYENIEEIDYEQVLKWIDRKLKKQINEYTCILVDGNKAGYFHFYPSDGQMELDDLFIFPQYRNQGIATAVIKRCCAQTDQPIFLYVFSKNQKALRLYEKLGFKISEEVHHTRYIMRYER